MDDGDFVRREWKIVADGLNAVFKILIVEFLAFKNQRIDYEYLTSGGNLFLEKIVSLMVLIIRNTVTTIKAITATIVIFSIILKVETNLSTIFSP